jgi:CRP/FNR family cyclic AMP-dependent transcriptional regulator
MAVLQRNVVPPNFDAAKFLATAGVGRTVLKVAANQVLFSQGDEADVVFYVQAGRIRLSVVSQSAKEATIALLSQGEFVGEDCVANGHPLRLASANAMEDSIVLRIDRKEMLRVLHKEHEFSDVFVSFLLARNARIQDDLVDQLFNSTEKRLARILLLLAQFGKPGKPEAIIPKLSHKVLAEMVGTTRSRVTFFLNRFRKLGFIQYNGRMEVHNSLLNVVLHDSE